MGKTDVAVKNWLSQKERFADFFNGTIFDGRQVVLPEELTIMNSEADFIVRDKSDKQKGRAVQRYRDITMRWKSGAVLMILACEVQDKIHYAMPVRNMLYDSLLYINQMKEIWNELSMDEKKDLNAGEFFSRFRKGDRLCPVITLVFYYGVNEWDASTDLFNMFELDSNVDVEVLKKYVTNYHINLIEPTKIADLSTFKTDLQMMFGVLKCREDKGKITEYVDAHKDYFKAVDIETAQALAEMIKADRIVKQLNKTEKEEYNMCKALDDLYNDGVAEGEIKGEIKNSRAFILDFLSDYGEISENLREKICTESDIEVLKKWTKLSARVSTIDEFEEKICSV